MSKLIVVVGVSGVGKTALVRALSNAHPFATAYEQHTERPFQALFKNDSRYAFANQIDYLLLRGKQEGDLRAASQIGLMDGGLDLDFHGFAKHPAGHPPHFDKLSTGFHSRGLLTDSEYDLCRRAYTFIRELFPRPELIIRLRADESTVASRLSTRERINIAGAEDSALFNSFLDEWIAGIPSSEILELDVSNENLEYKQSVSAVLEYILKRV